ncbi:hypothetical protein C9994_10920 [Marivirga lumbricoides]|uniref:Bile acid:sodium symporter n=1 Tax=Marivirga lumbricoides TaxID=1046115 RepID=A0A2T4DP65_9BACT|nr:hypothetical protein C9994_10920 [Marivirga lumbricoides]
MKPKIDKFILAIIAVVAFAYFVPFFVFEESPVPLDLIGSIGIFFIFFFYGLKLSPEKLRSGLKNWKLHVLVHLSTFLIFPLIVLLFYPVMNTPEGQPVWLAFFFLAALPSTVSSSVVMVSMAKGNVTAAIFNATISGFIGIIITPLWMGLFLIQETNDLNLADTYIKLITEILLPVIIGMLLQRYLGKYPVKYQKQLSVFDKSVVLLIIYKSFAESFRDKVFSSVNFGDLLLIIFAVAILFLIMYYLIRWTAVKLQFNKQDMITAQFCGTKKSLVHGTVFSKILFPASYSLGLVLLPLMLFHAFQTFVISIIASRLARITLDE